jgi:hypothetical protein
MTKKVQIHQFDPVIYPINLWVMISDDLDEIANNFIESSNHSRIDLSELKSFTDAFVCSDIMLSRTKDYGILIVFKNKKACSLTTIAHEATHAARYIWEHLCEDKIGMEADAYLVEWIVKSILEVKNNQFNK